MIWLITGGCGFIGSNLANTLLGQDTEVVILDNLSRIGSTDNLTWLRDNHGKDFPFILADVRKQDEVEKVLKQHKPSVIAHLAGQVAMTASLKNPRLDFETNALGTFNVLEAARLYTPESVILYSSTNKVYGSLDYLHYVEGDTRFFLPDYPNGLDELLPIDGYSPYGCSKLSAEQYVHDYHRIFGLQTIVFRHSSMYGGRQFSTFDQGWIGWFCEKALETINNKTSFTISGNGKQVRDILHSDDLISIYINAIDKIGRAAGEIFNIGGGMENSLSLIELFKILEALTNTQLVYSSINWRVGDQKVFVANNNKATQYFNWNPTINKENGIMRMLDWIRDVKNSK